MLDFVIKYSEVGSSVRGRCHLITYSNMKLIPVCFVKQSTYTAKKTLTAGPIDGNVRAAKIHHTSKESRITRINKDIELGFSRYFQ
jgi:hypothetical protein